MPSQPWAATYDAQPGGHRLHPVGVAQQLAAAFGSKSPSRSL